MRYRTVQQVKHIPGEYQAFVFEFFRGRCWLFMLTVPKGQREWWLILSRMIGGSTPGVYWNASKEDRPIVFGRSSNYFLKLSILALAIHDEKIHSHSNPSGY